MNFVLDQKPSSLRGRTSNDWGLLTFSSDFAHKDEPFAVSMSASYGPDRDASSEQPSIYWNQAAFIWKAQPEISAGLIYDPVVDFAWMSFWGSDLGPDFETGLSKWKVIPLADMGLSVAQDFGAAGIWTLQSTNGEGWPTREKGARKDFELAVTKTWEEDGSKIALQGFVRHGGYDQLGPDNNVKQRGGLQGYYQRPSWVVGLLGVQMKDSADGANNFMGEGVDLTNRGGQIVDGRFVEYWLGYKWGEPAKRWRMYYRGAELTPDVKDSGKRVQQNAVAIGRRLIPGMELSLAYQTTDFKPGYSSKLESRSRWFLAWTWALAK